MIRAAIGTLLALLPFAPAFAQTHSEQITVNVVDVPVYVDRWGRAVEGLTKDDFRLFINGRSQQIDYFDVIRSDGDDGAAQERDAPPLHRRRLFMLLFDAGTLSFHGAVRSKQQASELVDAARPGDAFAVAVGDSRIMRVIVPFTADRVATKRAIQTWQPSAARDAFAIATLAGERAAWSGAAGGSLEGLSAGGWDGSGSRSRDEVQNGGFLIRSVARTGESFQAIREALEAAHNRHVTSNFTQLLGELADRLTPLSGLKQVILFSERESRETPWIRSDLDEMQRRFLSAGTFLNVVDAGVLRAPSEIGGPKLGRQSLLYALSMGTGGTVAGSAVSLRDSESVVYVIGFRPSGEQRKMNDIRVRLPKARFGTTVRYRPQYGVDRRTADVSLLLADVLLNNIPQHGLTTVLTATPSNRSVKLVASIPGAELLAFGDDARLEMYFYVFDAQNLVAEWSYMPVTLDLVKGRELLSKHSFKLQEEVPLRPGKYAAKVLVRAVGRDATGFARAELLIPEP